MVKKKVRAKPRTKKAKPTKATREAFRKRIRSKFQKKLDEGVKLAVQLQRDGLSPDEIASRVRARVEGLSDEVAGDVTRFMNGAIFIRME